MKYYIASWLLNAALFTGGLILVGCNDDASVCGDGVIQDAEECDDENTDSGDGCQSDCTIQCNCGGTVCYECDDEPSMCTPPAIFPRIC